MRKFLIPLLMVSAAMPAAAQAQWRSNDKDKSERSDRQDSRSERPQRAERSERAERPERAERQQVQRQQIERPQIERRQIERVQVERGDRVFDGAVRQQVQREQVRPQRDVEVRRDGHPTVDGQRRGWDAYRNRVITQGQTTANTPSRDPNWRDRDGDGRRWSGTANAQRWATRDGSWSRHWRGDNRYDWRRHRDRNRTTFRLGFYFDPYGYNYRRFNVGYNMWPSYYQSSYWIQDPWMYRLPEVWGPYRWVRYYNDAMLVNIYTGQVEDVLYNFFW